MKTKLRLVMMVISIILQMQNAAAQRKTLTVLNFDTQNLGFNPQQMGNLVRLELDKLDTFEVMDRYDVAYLVQKNSLNIENCYGKIGLTEVGKALKSEKMLTGSVELYGENIIISMRLIDVGTSVIEKSQVFEFLNLPREIQTMVRITLRALLNKPNDQQMVETLTKKSSFENPRNMPDKNKLNLSGPRMGATMFTGKTASRLRESKETGGFEAFPVMFQFGYQFEIQYLNQGNFQALFEFIPLVTGLDQGIIVPSFTILNGLRNNKNGLEFAFGPTFSLASVAEGFYDANNKWQLRKDYAGPEEGMIFTDRMDSRGKPTVSPGFIFAIGKSFRSGKLNIPVNTYIIPHKDGVRFGLSFGYNALNNVRN